MITAIITALGKLVSWWTDRQAAKAAALHDAGVRQAQADADGLKGANDAVKQVDAVGAALDVPDAGVSADPNNRNR